MNLKNLEIFLRVYESGSLTNASAKLGIAQPSLSRAISSLEQDFGGALFHRTGRGVTLTELGEAALPRISSLITHVDEVATELRDLGGSPTGVVAIGMLPSMTTPLVARLFDETQNRFPGIQLRIYEGFSDQIEHWVAMGHVDIGVLSRYRATKQEKEEVLLDSGLMLVGAHGNLLSNSNVDFHVLQNLPLILPVYPNGLRVLVEDTAKRQGVMLNIVLEADSLRVQKDVVKQHKCFTILSPQAVFEEIVEGHLSACHITNPVLSRQAILTSTTSRPLSRGAREVFKMVKSIVQSLREEHNW